MDEHLDLSGNQDTLRDESVSNTSICFNFSDRHRVRHSHMLRHGGLYRPSFRDQGNSRRQSGPHNRPHPGQPVYLINGVALLHEGRLFRRGESERLEDPPHYSRLRPHVFNHAFENTLPGLVHRRCFHHSH